MSCLKNFPFSDGDFSDFIAATHTGEVNNFITVRWQISGYAVERKFKKRLIFDRLTTQSRTKNVHFLCDTVSKVKSNYFIVRPKVDQRAGQLSLPHLGINFF